MHYGELEKEELTLCQQNTLNVIVKDVPMLQNLVLILVQLFVT